MQVGLRTELEIARSTDKTDLDPLRIGPLPVADRILVLCEGRITADLPREQASEETIMHAATQFLARAAG